MAATGNEAVTLSQLASALDITPTSSGATGNEIVTLSQLKTLVDSKFKKYTVNVEIGDSTSPSSELINQTFHHDPRGYYYPGDVVILENRYIAYIIYIYEESTRNLISDKSSIFTREMSDCPEIVKAAIEKIPQTFAPPVSSEGYSWFIMPPCNVIVYASG